MQAIPVGRTLALCLLLSALPLSGETDEQHPLMHSKWWFTAGAYAAKRDFEASAGVSIGGGSARRDFEGELGIDDDSAIFMGELAWQFAKKWGVTLQYFESDRSGSKELERDFEWQGNTYVAGGRIDAGTSMQITRIVFARRFYDDGPHSLRLGAGLHWLSIKGEIAGDVRLNDQSLAFRRSAATAEVPVPNIGAWYRYSPNRNWLFSARVDWLSANIDNFSGRIWNTSVGATLRLTDHLGIGANFQFFELAGGLTEPKWRGDLSTTFTGPYVYLNGFW